MKRRHFLGAGGLAFPAAIFPFGCIAPRRVYVASASADDWADPRAEFLSCRLASPLHQFFGAEGFADESIHGGSIGYHLREGKHNLTPYDWEQFLEFAGRA